ncbi:acetoacetate--CoA ligase [Sulfolobus sp. S-194]|uniref:acetoacetate--CoA ligase n=1 Tax=Sulfolobus sp. S-194 TaxID=2512240 RepID=UPI0014372DB1|nr:acetoacetate--CoA ligase [Sulfolobus sp. S-194]QIW22913.1 acetoacetate--CoA ligase [Sulfolobus sp. S-194]
MPEVLWIPSEKFIKESTMANYVEWLKNNGYDFDISYDPMKNIEYYNRLWKWSVIEPENFWKTIWDYFHIITHTPYINVMSSRQMPGVKWFSGSTLNYVEYIFRNIKDKPSIIYRREDRLRKVISWNEMVHEVSSLASFLKQSGVKKGDRIVGYISQRPEAVIGLLASASIGAIWSVAGLELGVTAVIDRFKQLQPKVLIVADGYIYNGKRIDKREDVKKLINNLPSLELIIIVPSLDENFNIYSEGKKVVKWDEIHTKEKIEFEFVDFNYPLWIIYTSGTTGIPKPIVHSHGGILIEALKASLHLNLKGKDRFLWYSTPSWMMWNVVVNALLYGSTVVFYDGNPMYNNLTPLWEIAEKEELTFLGLSAPFIHSCVKSALEPGSQYNLKNLKAIGSTAAPLSVSGFEWVYKKVKQDIWLTPGSGGTDVMTAFVGGCPILPVWSGEMQCRWLGVSVQAFDSEGKPVINEVGELVITEPMPSMPIYFWGDDNYKWYKESYFNLFPNVWWHGDWIMITDRGTAIIYGRSDSTIKRKGVRMGTLDIYKIVESIPEVQNSMAIEAYDNLILYVVLKGNLTLDESLKQKIEDKMRQELGPYFIPDYIIQVPDIPLTLNFKKLEVPVKKILMGWDINKAVRIDSITNPDALYILIELSKQIIEEIKRKRA